MVSAEAATGRVVKMLPFFLDLQGRHMLGANLYERDSYQLHLREHPEERSGMRFDVQWKVHGTPAAPLKIKIELRGGIKDGPIQQTVLETEAKPGHWFSTWTSLKLLGDDYQNFGEVTAWRTTLWEGDKLIGEQKSFLW
jgi:hypothetical protein